MPKRENNIMASNFILTPYFPCISYHIYLKLYLQYFLYEKSVTKIINSNYIRVFEASNHNWSAYLLSKIDNKKSKKTILEFYAIIQCHIFVLVF